MLGSRSAEPRPQDQPLRDESIERHAVRYTVRQRLKATTAVNRCSSPVMSEPESW